LVRHILVTGLRCPGVKPGITKVGHLMPGVTEDKMAAILAGEEQINIQDFALDKDSTPRAKDTIKSQYNHMLITAVARHAGLVAAGDVATYGYWRPKDWFRYVAQRVREILQRWEATFYRDGESRDDFITRVAQEGLSKRHLANMTTVRHNKHSGRMATATTYWNAGTVVNDPRYGQFAQYVLQTLHYLGPGGMSDEEDGTIVNDAGQEEEVKFVARLPWRATALTHTYHVLDALPDREPLIFNRSGARKIKRVHTDDPPQLARAPPSNVPKACFDAGWLAEDAFRVLSCKVDCTTEFELLNTDGQPYSTSSICLLIHLKSS
ncbi:hypothetical protein EV122DRAFT_227207, partial [Schizophyllum commune]